MDPQDADDDEEAVGGFDFTAGEGTFNQDDYTMQPDSSLNNTTLMGDKLVSQPNKVSQGVLTPTTIFRGLLETIKFFVRTIEIKSYFSCLILPWTKMTLHHCGVRN